VVLTVTIQCRKKDWFVDHKKMIWILNYSECYIKIWKSSGVTIHGLGTTILSL